jgi:nucleotide-binding universal stress UspA family protein
MDYKRITAVTGGTETNRSAIGLAFAVGKRFNAHVEALHVRADPRQAIPYMGEGMSGAMVDDILRMAEKEAAERAAKARAVFDELCKANSVPIVEAPTAMEALMANWREVVGRDEEVIARRGRVTDLIIAARPLASAELPSTTILEAALLDTGRALLIAPPNPPAEVGGTAVIAWLGSVEASRAVASALPFLGRAKQVRIVAWGEQLSASSVNDLRDYLAWHGIEARISSIDAPGTDVGEPLLAECRTAGASLLVMGGYTRSRLRHMILGGTTSHVMHKAEIPVLMAH